MQRAGVVYLGEGQGMVLASPHLGHILALQAGHHLGGHHRLLHNSNPLRHAISTISLGNLPLRSKIIQLPNYVVCVQVQTCHC